MIELDLTVLNHTGLHARPARELVNLAKKFSSKIKIAHGDRSGNAKSLISVLKLGVASGGAVRFQITGEDEAEAAEQLRQAVLSGLGEEVVAHDSQSESEPEQVSAPAEAPEVPVAKPAEFTFPVDFNGVAASGGLALGPIFQLQVTTVSSDSSYQGAPAETARLYQALADATEELNALSSKLTADGVTDAAKIFDVHADLIADDALLDQVKAAIASGKRATKAWADSIEDYATELSQMPDPILSARSSDLRDVGRRVTGHLTGTSHQMELPTEPVVIVAEELFPSETAMLDPNNVLGIITASGGATDHAAILARALALPAIVSAGPEILKQANGTQVLFDGAAGTIALNPSDALQSQAKAAIEKQRARNAALREAAKQMAKTTDGHLVEIGSNAGSLEDVQRGTENGTDGIGLFRTEFLYLGRDSAPTEEEQGNIYRSILEELNGKPLIIRTLDIGGDKVVPYMDLPEEANPFLGVRGIRLSLSQPDLFRAQLRTILTLPDVSSVRIMFPMIATLEDWRKARAVVTELQNETGVTDIKVGMMVEVPSAAVLADMFASEVDFFSIGTNDLTQYTLAMDRTNSVLTAQLDGLHPAVLRLIAKVAEAAKSAGKWAGVCGELGGDLDAVPILIGLGLNELSVAPPLVGQVKDRVRNLSYADCQQLAKKALQQTSAAAVRALVRSQ